MTLSLLQTLRAGPPPPKVVLLPDAMFFARTVPVGAGASMAEVAAQVELALETLSPFPPAQLYHGYFWRSGATTALVFAAYRRRFTAEQIATWDDAELVLPAFAALLGGDVKPETTLVVPSADGLTAVYFDGGPVPARVSFRPLSAEATDEERARARADLLAQAPGHRPIVLAAAPAVMAAHNEREFAFRAEAFASRLPAAEAGAIDVRDKEALSSLRRARSRDLVLWRTFVGMVALLGLLVVGEFGIVGARMWQKTLTTQASAQRPVVEKVMTAQNLTTRINELSTRRLLPIEMILLLSDPKLKPAAIQFLRTSSTGLYGLIVEAQSTSPAAVSAYQAALHAHPALEKVDLRVQPGRENVMPFTLTVTFRPEQLKPATTATP